MKNSRFKSIYVQNFIKIAIPLLLSFIILGIAFTGASYSIVMSEKAASMSSTAEEVSKVVSAYSYQWDMRSFEVRMALSTTETISGFPSLLCDRNGTIISTSERTIHSDYVGKTVPQEMLYVIDTLGEFGEVSDLGGILPEEQFVVGKVISAPETGQAMGYVLLRGDTQSMSQLWRNFSGIFIWIALVVLVAVFIITYRTSRQQAQPINEMASAARRFARGEYDVRVEATGREDEIGELADAFNLMADSIERSENLRREFIANVSHELKTPMTTITGFADGIIDGTIPPEKQEKYLKVISSETKRLSRLVKSMLDMSQIQAMDTAELLKKRMDISEVVRLTMLSLEKKITAKELNIEAQLPEESIITKGDEDSITQVFYNLLDNAIKFSEFGSTVKVELWKQGGKAYVSVENTGEEIKPEELNLIFDRFHKSDRSRSLDKDGVGLGLYIVKTILDNHNENIFVTSHDDVTRFVFSLSLV